MTSKAIDQYWRTFVDHKDLFADPKKDKESQGAFVLDALKRVDPRLDFHVGYRDAGADLLLSAEGYYDLSDVMVECLKCAPSCTGWRFRPILESDSLFGKRNAALFPDDENGDILFDIAAHAGDLITPKEVDFCHIFRAEPSARSFICGLGENDETSIEPYKGVKGFHWEVRVVRRMIPSHHNITMNENQLAALANQAEGRPDGWGFMSE